MNTLQPGLSESPRAGRTSRVWKMGDPVALFQAGRGAESAAIKRDSLKPSPEIV